MMFWIQVNDTNSPETVGRESAAFLPESCLAFIPARPGLTAETTASEYY